MPDARTLASCAMLLKNFACSFRLSYRPCPLTKDRISPVFAFEYGMYRRCSCPIGIGSIEKGLTTPELGRYLVFLCVK